MTSVESEEANELRARVAEYERIFRSAAPRLAAFRRLEEIARERKTTPVAIATRAAIEVLKQEQQSLEQAAQHYITQRNELEGEVAMLLEKKNDTIEVLDDLKIQHHDIHIEVGEILDELNLLRDDAVRLMTERSDLELHIRALKLELAHLEKRRSTLVGATDEDEPAELRPTTAPGKHAADFELTDGEDPDEGERFDKFFHATVEHDKARDWILG